MLPRTFSDELSHLVSNYLPSHQDETAYEWAPWWSECMAEVNCAHLQINSEGIGWSRQQYYFYNDGFLSISGLSFQQPNVVSTRLLALFFLSSPSKAGIGYTICFGHSYVTNRSIDISGKQLTKLWDMKYHQASICKTSRQYTSSTSMRPIPSESMGFCTHSWR